MKATKIISVDAETNGLYGQAFCLAAVVMSNAGQVLDEFIGRCPIEGPVNPWVEQNVLPGLSGVAENYPNYVTMLEGFYAFYMWYKKDSTMVGHVVHPVESKVLRDMIEQDLEGRQWDGPFPLIDVAGVLLAKGQDPSSVDAYNVRNDIEVGFEGGTHHPLYDAYAAAVAYLHLMGLSKEALLLEEIEAARLNLSGQIHPTMESVYSARGRLMAAEESLAKHRALALA